MTIQGCRRLSIATFACMFAILAATDLQAATFTTYTNEADFLNAVFLPVDTDDFQDLPAFPVPSPTSRTVGSYEYTATTAAGNFLPIEKTTPSAKWLSTTDAATIITFTIDAGSSPVNAIGGNFFVTNLNGNLVEGEVTVTVNGGQAPLTVTTSSSSNFFGWVGLTEITSLEFTPSATNFATVDNLTFAVPEPSTYAMLGMGVCFASLGAIRRRAKLARS